MASLRYSAADESEDAYDVSTSLTGYEPNFVTFGELNDSSVPFSFMIPSSDQDMDDVTLGKLLTEAHRGQADCCEPEGMSVSQSSSSVVFDGSGQPDGECYRTELPVLQTTSSQEKDPACLVQVEEHRDGYTGTTKSNAFGPVIFFLQRGTALWLPRQPPTDWLPASRCGKQR